MSESKVMNSKFYYFILLFNLPHSTTLSPHLYLKESVWPQKVQNGGQYGNHHWIDGLISWIAIPGASLANWESLLMVALHV